MGCFCDSTEVKDGNILEYKKYIDAYKDIKSCRKLIENNNESNFNGFLIRVNSITKFLALINTPKVPEHLNKINNVNYQDYQDQFLKDIFDNFESDQNIIIISDYKECQSYIKQNEKKDNNNEFIIVGEIFVNNMCNPEDINDNKKVEIDPNNKKIIFSSKDVLGFRKNNDFGYYEFIEDKKEIENKVLLQSKNPKNNYSTENNIINVADGTQNISQNDNKISNDIILYNKNNIKPINDKISNEKNEVNNNIIILYNNKNNKDINFIKNSNEKKDENDKCTIIPNEINNINNDKTIPKKEGNNNNNNIFNDSNISDGNFIEASFNNLDNSEINNFDKINESQISEGAFMEVSITDLNNAIKENNSINKNIFQNINNSNIVNKNSINFDFIKSVIQCLLNVNSLTNYFLSNKENFLSIPKNTEEKPFSKAFSETLYNSYDENNNKCPYSLNSFQEIIKQEKNNFIESSENNMKSFFIYERMHNELNEKDKNNKIDEFYSNQTDPEIEFYKCLNNFENRNKSIISDLFYFSEGNIKKCNQCNIALYNFTMHNFLIFPLYKIKLYKEKKNESFDKIDILDCFEYYITEENNNTDNKIVCKACNNEYEICNKISSLPEIFTIFLDREEYNDLEFKIDYAIEDLDKYMIKFNNIIDNQKSKYELIGIVIRDGKEEKNGVFLNYSKFPDGKWHLYINNKFEFVSDPILEIKSIPYFLLYQKIKD